nr:ATP synthase F0 subunit 8 [Potamogale velox]
MPQLDTSTWTLTIMSMLISLFIILQLKLSKLTFPHKTHEKSTKITTQDLPWEHKWTKIYFPNLKSQQ